MTLAVPLILFGVFLLSVILIFVCIASMGVSIAKNPLSKYTHNYTWGYIIAYLFTLLLVLVANVGWWGGWITLIIWGVQKIA